MNKRVEPIARLALGLLLLFHGFVSFLPETSQLAQLFPKPELSAQAQEFFNHFANTGYMIIYLVFFELIIGLALVINRFVPLALVLLLPLSINAVSFHLFLDPRTMLPALVLFVLNIILIYIYYPFYKPFLKKQEVKK